MNYLVLGLGLGVLGIGGWLFLESRKNSSPPPASPILSDPSNQDAYEDWRKGERGDYR